MMKTIRSLQKAISGKVAVTLILSLSGLILAAQGTTLSGADRLEGGTIKTAAVVGQWAQAQDLSGGEIITSVGVWIPQEEGPTGLVAQNAQKNLNNNLFNIRIGMDNSIEWNYSLNSANLSSIEVFSLTGEKVHTLMQENSTAGTHRWEGRLGKDQLNSGGAYIVRFRSGNQQQSYRLNVK